MSDIEQAVRDRVARAAKLAPHEVEADADLFNDLRIDSMEGLKLLAELEKQYRVMIPDHKLLEVNTLRKIVNEIQTQLR